MSSSEEEDLKLAMVLSMQSHPSTMSSRSGARGEAIDLTSDTEDEDEDEELKKAMALSLHGPNTPDHLEVPSADLISNTEDEDEDEDLKKAIALSLNGPPSPDQSDSPSAEIHTAVTTNAQQADRAVDVSLAPSSTAGAQTSFGGMDRKAMEQERLARLGKRKRGSTPEQPSKRATGALSVADPQRKSMTPASPAAVLQFPRGVIKRTFAKNYPRTDDITIEELLQAPSVHTAVISSFQWDAEWMHEKLNPINVKQIWIMNAKPKDVQERWIREMEANGVPNLKLHFPPMDGMIFSMHSKFLLLFGKHKLRFAVTTANMIQTDWGEVANGWQPGVMENTVFVIDLPRLGDHVPGDATKLTKFGQELVFFLEQQKVQRNVIDGVLGFDFSQTDHLAFVHSIGGVAGHTEDCHPTGLPGLARAVKDLQLDGVEHIEIDYAASSLGAVNDSFLQRIHLAARGIDFDTRTQPNSVRKDFRIYFPTKETVEKSTGGPDCAGMVSLAPAYYKASTFPRECLRDYDSTRRGMLSHNKLLFARGRKRDGKPVAWVYVGSANLSESAWGGQKVLKSGKLGSLNIKNWECGVVMPVPEDALRGSSTSDGEVPPMSVFERVAEVPFHYPGPEYGQRLPWHCRWN